MPGYIDRVIYALFHINVPIPSPVGFRHWFNFHLGPYTATLLIIGLIIGYTIKKYH